jgi:hypothetical protein
MKYGSSKYASGLIKSSLIKFSLMGASLLLLAAQVLNAQSAPVWSPDHSLYAVAVTGRHVVAAKPEHQWHQWHLRPVPHVDLVSNGAAEATANNEDRNRLIVYDKNGNQLSVAYLRPVGLEATAPGASRNCEQWGWVDQQRLYCRSILNPEADSYRVFDAATGVQLMAFTGSHFVWSPDHTRVANYGVAEQFFIDSNATNVLEIQDQTSYPAAGDNQEHYFLSEPIWSADGQYLAAVDYRPAKRAAYLVVVNSSGLVFEQKLDWQMTNDETWVVAFDFKVNWKPITNGQAIYVEHASATRTIDFSPASNVASLAAPALQGAAAAPTTLQQR